MFFLCNITFLKYWPVIKFKEQYETRKIFICRQCANCSFLFFILVLCCKSIIASPQSTNCLAINRCIYALFYGFCRWAGWIHGLIYFAVFLFKLGGKPHCCNVWVSDFISGWQDNLYQVGETAFDIFYYYGHSNYSTGPDVRLQISFCHNIQSFYGVGFFICVHCCSKKNGVCNFIP